MDFAPTNGSATSNPDQHLVLIPTYNTGAKLVETVKTVLEYWRPVWIVIDGSTDGSGDMLASQVRSTQGVRVIRLPENRGKGAAVLAGMAAASKQGYSYVLVMDADGQHPPERIPEFMRISKANPASMVLGVPEFGSEAPMSRKYGRRVGNWWSQLETLWGGIKDSLFGFRVYPIEESLKAMASTSRGRRFDFDTELAVRLYWAGVQPINVPVPVRYLSRLEGGVSHFHFVRDNVLLVRTHVCLVLSMLARLPALCRLRLAR
jgi:glycosyltransferase involved in cell wall biosynthesis